MEDRESQPVSHLVERATRRDVILDKSVYELRFIGWLGTGRSVNGLVVAAWLA